MKYFDHRLSWPKSISPLVNVVLLIFPKVIENSHNNTIFSYTILLIIITILKRIPLDEKMHLSFNELVVSVNGVILDTVILHTKELDLAEIIIS